MAISKCGRCGEKSAKPEVCSSCKRAVCHKCIYASKKVNRKDIRRLVMCKDCWTNMAKRKDYRHATMSKEDSGFM